MPYIFQRYKGDINFKKAFGIPLTV